MLYAVARDHQRGATALLDVRSQIQAVVEHPGLHPHFRHQPPHPLDETQLSDAAAAGQAGRGTMLPAAAGEAHSGLRWFCWYHFLHAILQPQDVGTTVPGGETGMFQLEVQLLLLPHLLFPSAILVLGIDVQQPVSLFCFA